MQYLYKARNLEGQFFQGRIDSPSEDLAADLLADRGLSVVSLLPISSKTFKERFAFELGFLNAIKKKDLVIFARQMAVMISANLPVVQALRIVIQQTENKNLQKIIEVAANEVESGSKLSATLGQYPKVFTNFFISMIKSGETSGRLDEILEYLAAQEEEDYDLLSKIKGAMIYPIFIIGGLIIVGAAMMIFVIPKLTGILVESGAKLPFSTRMLIGASDFSTNYWWLIILIVGGGIMAFRWFIKSEEGSKLWGTAKIHIPIFGHLFKMIYLVRFTHSMSTLIVGGIPLVAALRVVSDVVGNDAYRRLIDDTIKEVEDGNSVSTVFMRSGLIPKMVSNMMAVGEKTGRLDQIMKKLSDFYSREITNMINNLTHILEPLIMIIIGVAVGLMVSAIILPMYQLANTF